MGDKERDSQLITDNGGNLSAVSGEVVDINNIIIAKLESLSLDMKSIKEKLVDLEYSNNNTAKKVESVDNNLKEALLTLQKNREDINKLKADNAMLRHEVRSLNLQLYDLQQSSQSNSLRITNVPFVQDENLKLIFQKICQFIDLSFDVNFIEIFRLRPRKLTPSPPIILKFVKLEDKIRFMQCLKPKKHKLTTNIVTGLMPGAPVYISENMSPLYAKLFNRARKLKADNLINSVWFTNNSLFIKISEGSNAVRIQDESDLEVFSNKDNLSVVRSTEQHTSEIHGQLEDGDVDTDTSEVSRSALKKRKYKFGGRESIDRFFRPQSKEYK